MKVRKVKSYLQLFCCTSGQFSLTLGRLLDLGEHSLATGSPGSVIGNNILEKTRTDRRSSDPAYTSRFFVHGPLHSHFFFRLWTVESWQIRYSVSIFFIWFGHVFYGG